MNRKAKTLSLLGLGSIVVLGLVYWRFHPRNDSPPMTQSRTAPEPHGIERTIHFPEDESIGYLRFRGGPNTGRDLINMMRRYPAKGLVTVPAGKHVILIVGNNTHDLNRFASFSAIGETENIRDLRVYHNDPRQESDPTISSWLHHWTSLPRLDLKIDKLRADDLEGMEKLTSLRRLIINVTEIDDNALREIGKVPSLQSLELRRTGITDNGLRHLVGLQTLQSLVLQNTGFTDNGLPGITDNGLRHLVGLQNLVELRIDDATITGDGLADLRGLPELRTLSLTRASLVDDAINHILTFPHLMALLLDSTDLSDVGLMKLAGAPHLQVLYVGNTAVTRAGVLSFTQIAPHIRVFSDFPPTPTPTPKKPVPVS